MNEKNFLEEAFDLAEELSQDRRSLHRNAETGFAMTKTKEYVKKRLTEIGCAPKDCGKAGLTASIGGKRGGKVFLLRADMDALPICEQTGLDFACPDGAMHACGHDMHTAMLLGAAKLLKRREDKLNGTVKLMFQPAEEIFEGSQDMLRAGVLKNPDVDAALMIHVMAGMPFKAGSVIVSAGGVSAPAADYFTITVKGRGCHGSMPNTGIDPLSAAAHIVTALQEIHARELAVGEKAVLTIGTMNAGTAANVIPDTVTMGGTVRAFDEDVRALLKTRIAEISRGIAAAFRAEAETEFGSGCPTLVNDSGLSSRAERYVKELLGSNMAFSAEELQKASGNVSSKPSGSEDFAYVSHAVPSVMLALAAGSPEQGYVYPQHHPQVRFDESALPYGAAVYAYTALRWMEEEQISSN